VLLVAISALFGLFVIALLVRSRLADWQALVGVPGGALATSAPLWANTGLLAASSAALQFAASAARRGRNGACRLALGTGAALALAFLAAQGGLWAQFAAAGHLVASHPAASFFYLLTGVHGLHLAGGLIALGRAGLRAWREPGSERQRLGVALCAHYWHYLLAVWLLLFALLASTPDTLATLADICGIG
jgi:cytochrome c oxidase subunit 3